MRLICILFILSLSSQIGWTQTTQQDATTASQQPSTTVQPATEAPVALKPSDYRLPTSLNPVHYLVRLQPFINGNFSIHGYVEITMNVVKPTKEVTLHMRSILTKNETAKVYLADNPDATVRILKQKYDRTRQFYVATLDKQLEVGKNYVFAIEFVGTLNDHLDGFYRSSYIDEQGNKRWLAATQFQPVDGRLAFLCFDEPALKAEFSIEIIRPANMTSVSNMPIIEILPIENQPGWVLDRFQKSVKMSLYLVAFMVSDLTYVQTNVHDKTTLSVWTRPAAIHQASYALDVGKRSLLFFEDYFNISYPLPKTDMVALPDFSAGAMENWGLVNYREAYLIYDPKKSPIRTKSIVGSIIAHELAHQWFGNLVTPTWWTDLWLNEGFATWMAVVCHDFIEPKMQNKEKFLSKLRSALLHDSLENSHPISITVGNPDEIAEIFDAISYSKGASLIRMMTYFLTESTFRSALTKYLNHFAYSSAEQDDLWHYLTLQAIEDKTLPLNVTVKEIMDTWTLQMGYPVIDVTVNDDGTANISQERFLQYKNPNSTDTHDYKWWVPITFATQSSPDFSKTNPDIWMRPSETNKVISGMPAKNQWVVFNNLQSGFYRVNYQMENWKNIVQQLKTNHLVFPGTTRAQLIGDAFQLAKSGALNYTIPLSMMSYLNQEKGYMPLKFGVSESGFLRGIMKYTKYQPLIENYTLSLMAPHYDELGFLDQEGDSYLTQNKRGLVTPLVCDLNYTACINSALSLYRAWMQDPTNNSIILPNVQSIVYCNGIKYGGLEEYEFAWQQYHSLDLDTQKKKLLSAIGCTRNETQRTEYLDVMFKADGPVRKQDTGTSFGSIGRDREGTLLAWRYLQQNWDRISEYLLNKQRMIGLILRATGFIKTRAELKELDDFIASKPELQGTGTRSLEQLRESKVGKIIWIEENLETVGNFLEEENLQKLLI